MNLFRSNDNLESGAIKFVEDNDSITLFSAYLKVDELEFINQTKTINRIIVRWEIRDLCMGVSDLGLYEYCLKNNITLFRNTRIHLKAFWNNEQDVFFGSANVTGRGIGEKGKFNYELNGIANSISFKDINYFNKLINESKYVDQNLFDLIQEEVEKCKGKEVVYPEILYPEDSIDSFLISQLPMSENPEILFSIYDESKNFSLSDFLNASHDIALYKIPSGLDKNGFLKQLKSEFNEHPFIKEFKKTVKYSNVGTNRESSMGFGQVKRWFADNTTTVPTPRAFELNGYVSILYNWICFFDHEFNWSRPNHSQVIFFKSEAKKRLKSILENLNRDSNNGKLAPHQILLLIAMKREAYSLGSPILSIKSLKTKYVNVFNEYKEVLESGNRNFGMPIRALKNQQLIDINFNDDTTLEEKDYRIQNKLLDKVESVILSEELFTALNNCKEQDILNYL